jgi:hypothetical protein
MPRRGGSKQRGSGRNRAPQGSKRRDVKGLPAERRAGLVQRPARPKLHDMVETTGTCATGKLRYGTSADAAEALRRARANRAILGSEKVEQRWYPKPGDRPCPCGGYHLTGVAWEDRPAPKRGRSI